MHPFLVETKGRDRKGKEAKSRRECVLELGGVKGWTKGKEGKKAKARYM